MWRVWLVTLALVAPLGCRQVFGIDEPLPSSGGGGGIDARRFDGHDIFFDGAAATPGLAMYVQDGASLWMNDQSPDAAWAEADDTLAKTGVWTGADPSLGELVFEGLIDGQHPFSLWMEGQILVPQGMEQIQLTAADYAFFDVETVPFTGQFQHVVTSRNGQMQMRSISPPLPGWLRVRIGWTTTPASSDFTVTHSDGSNPSVVPFGTTNLRH